MTILENEYLKVGKNNLVVPVRLVNLAIPLQLVQRIELKVVMPFNYLYTFWKPSHFYTGLEAHSETNSWRTFRLSKNIFAAAKMYMEQSTFVAEIFANEGISDEEIVQLKNRISWSYGLKEPYIVSDEQVTNRNKYINSFFDLFKGTRISCPENIFEISVLSLLLQNTTISRTTNMFKKLIEFYGSIVMFDDVYLYTFFSPEDILPLPEEELKEKCRLGYRAKYIKNYAEFFSIHQESELRKLGRKDLLTLLETIKGVGAYTSNVVASHALRDTEAIPFDSWNRKILASRLYHIDPRDIDQLKERIISDFREHSGLIAMYVIENEYIDKPVVPLIPN